MATNPDFSATFSKQLSAYLHKDLPDETEDPFYGLKDKLHDLEDQKRSAQKQISDLEDQLASLRNELQDQLVITSDKKQPYKSDSVFELENLKSKVIKLEDTTEQPTDMQVQYEESYIEETVQSESLNVEGPSTRLSRNDEVFPDENKQSTAIDHKVEDVDHFAKSIDEYLYNTHEEIINQDTSSKMFPSSIQIEETQQPQSSVSSASPSPVRGKSAIPQKSNRKTVRIAHESIGTHASPRTKSYGTMTSDYMSPKKQEGIKKVYVTPKRLKTASTATETTDSNINRMSHPNEHVQEDRPPFLLGTTPTTYSINAILQQKRSQNKFSPAKIQETITSLTRKNYNVDVKHPKEENVIKRVVNALENERLLLVKYAKDITLIKLKVFKPGRLAKESVVQLYTEFSIEQAPNNQKLLEMKSRIRRVTVQPALERIVQKEFEYFFQVISLLI